MRLRLSILTFLSALALCAPSWGRTLLECTLAFGEITEVQIFEKEEAKYLRLLTNSGMWLKPRVLNDSLWQNRDFAFEHRMDLTHMKQTKNGRWEYRVYSLGSSTAIIVGTADCQKN